MTSINTDKKQRRVSVAPMMAWTDRHCRYFHRLITRHTWLYTEMITTGALLHGDVPHLLRFNPEENPLALQLGGSDPTALARCAKLGEAWHYDEINLNCGCPSERVQRGAFGACLMKTPELVAEAVRAMRDAVSIPITVKHRIGLDQMDSYAFVRDFVGTVAQAGCTTFIVHARNVVLQGLSAKENREIPPLKYDYAYQLKRDFPELEIILNGGVKTLEQIEHHLKHVDGVMLGREAYHNPWLLAQIDRRFYDDSTPEVNRTEVVHDLSAYAAQEISRGTPLNSITRHTLGLYHGMSGARGWRRTLSEHNNLAAGNACLFKQALEFVTQ